MPRLVSCWPFIFSTIDFFLLLTGVLRLFSAICSPSLTLSCLSLLYGLQMACIDVVGESVAYWLSCYYI